MSLYRHNVKTPISSHFGRFNMDFGSLSRYREVNITHSLFKDEFKAYMCLVFPDLSSIILMTPHRWQCDKYLTQTIMLDFLEASRLDIDELLLNLTLVSQKEPSQAHEILLKVDFLKSNGFREVDFQV